MGEAKRRKDNPIRVPYPDVEVYKKEITVIPSFSHRLMSNIKRLLVTLVPTKG